MNQKGDMHMQWRRLVKMWHQRREFTEPLYAFIHSTLKNWKWQEEKKCAGYQIWQYGATIQLVV